MEPKKIVICGGHLTPALAVISELQKKGGWEIYYLGRKYAMEGEKTPAAESQIIPQLGVSFMAFNPGRLQRRFTRYTIPSLLRIPFGFLRALTLLLQIRPQTILSFGGYVSVPVVIAGWLLRIPILTHEQTVVFGLASKINAFFANKVAVSFPESLKYFSKKKAVLTGNPIREEIFKIKKPAWSPILDSRFPMIYITGGSQGSHVINKAVNEIVTQLLEKYMVIHQTGAKDYPSMLQTADRISPELKSRYFIVSFINPSEIGWVFKEADLIVSRSGANTVSEIAALGKPALFIPLLGSYQDEQTKNAQMLVMAGTAEILPQEKLSGETLLGMISQMMADLEKYQKQSFMAQKLVNLDAGRELVRALETI